MKNIFVLSALLLLFGGCQSASNSSSASVPNIAGNWTINVTSSRFGDQITATGTVAQNGSQISGSLALTGDPCAGAAAMSGSLTGSAISMTLVEGGQDVNLTGTVATGAASASGSYTAAQGGCTAGDTGTWAATK